MKFTVEGIERLRDKGYKVTLEGRDQRTIYTSNLYLYVPVEDAPLYAIGDVFDLSRLPSNIPAYPADTNFGMGIVAPNNQ